MTSTIVVTEDFDLTWSWSAEHAAARWASSDLVVIRREAGDDRPLSQLGVPASTTRLLVLGLEVTTADVPTLPGGLREVGLAWWFADSEAVDAMRDRGIAVYRHESEGFWGQSVSEFGLGLTIAGLRRIPQTSRAMLDDASAWDYVPADGRGRPRARSEQFGDDAAFTSGTVAGKRVRVVGMGNIGARYASFCAMLGADVAGWDPIAPETAFHRSNARRVSRLADLVADAEIFAPMLPHLPATEGIVTAELIDALPHGCLVVCVTRMQILDAAALRRRVLADELALAADVFDVEPLPFDDPLLGRHNVVHTPHNAGRTIDANRAYIDALLDRFERVAGEVPAGSAVRR
jgi:phosphoglycerate dehydrogenase-like enzyme